MTTYAETYSRTYESTYTTPRPLPTYLLFSNFKKSARRKYPHNGHPENPSRVLPTKELFK